ncbi:energy transducer TonB [Lewinella sp. IMCC34183]|uniref:energy transducer TonB n=1 Tax=Lewinella sp. IMCC34183 TaxID=2248762 RepID=UPI000E260543|nr:energy transducer TonB [Lewinella sp. IMCC34183]
MRTLGLTSRFFLIGLGLSAALTLLAWGFRTAPDAAREELQAQISTSTVPTSCFPAPAAKESTRPLFPACGELPDFNDRRECSDKAMLQYIYKHIRYPKEAKDDNATGMVVVRFPIDALGNTGLPVVVRSPHPALGEAGLKVVRQMLRYHNRWEPARADGKPVAQDFMLPIQFKLE